jgi:hypothetical protein
MGHHNCKIDVLRLRRVAVAGRERTDSVWAIMRMTVGPLPPAVYWRRRVVVLGGLLLVFILLVYSCGSSGKSDASSNKASTSGSGSSASVGTETEPSTGAGSATPTAVASTSAAPTASPSKGDAAPDGSTATSIDPSLCTDDEMLITPVPASKQLPAGATLLITIKIKNKSSRTCKRDVGADLQELYIMVRGGAQKVWSSDDCGGPRGNDLEQFAPSFERAYSVSWNGRSSTTCTNQKAPTPGEYQLYGRLGTERSAPVTLTLT